MDVYTADRVYKALQKRQGSLEAKEEWTKHVAETGAKILRSQADFCYVGANIPGKARGLLTAPNTHNIALIGDVGGLPTPDGVRACL